METSNKTVTVTLRRSLIARTQRQVACARGLGLKRIGHSRTLQDTPEVRGMIRKISFVLEVRSNEA